MNRQAHLHSEWMEYEACQTFPHEVERMGLSVYSEVAQWMESKKYVYFDGQIVPWRIKLMAKTVVYDMFVNGLSKNDALKRLKEGWR